MVIIYERQLRFNDRVASQMVYDLVRGCEAVGTVNQDELAICPPSPSPGPYHRDIYQPSAGTY